MFSDVVVGVDEHQGGRDAVALARMLVAEGGQLTLAYVFHGDAHVWRGSSPPYEAAESERARERLEATARDMGIEAELRWHGSTSVGHGLHDLAQANGANLLVVGSSRRGLLGRVLLADDTRAALNGAPCAVAIAPGGYSREHAAIRDIGVGYDGSPESEHALKAARSLTAAHQAKLSALEVVSIPGYVLGVGPMLPEDALESLVEDAGNQVAALGDVEPHAAYGQPAEELGIFSDSLDLLVVGSRSYGPLGRLVHGSTSLQLARTARCPLLVLTRAARNAELSDVSGEDQGAVTAASG